MAEYSYPLNTVWYVEARPRAGTRDAPGLMQADPESMGSAVVVHLEKVGEDGKPIPDSAQKYLLTCAHVVRRSRRIDLQTEDALLEEIVCFPPGGNYHRTETPSRTFGKFPPSAARVARVSSLSPCKGKLEAREPSLRKALQLDWVLLELEDKEHDAKFQATAPAVEAWGQEKDAQTATMRIAGYPNGAGTQKTKESYYWTLGSDVELKVPQGFRWSKGKEPGLMGYEGGEETRPGMSGGGVFDADDRLMGIHQESVDDALYRGSIGAWCILEELWSNHRLRPVPPPPRQTPAKPEADTLWKRSPWLIGVGTLVVLALLAWAVTKLISPGPEPDPPTQPEKVTFKTRVRSLSSDGIGSVVPDLEVGFEGENGFEPTAAVKGKTDPEGLLTLTVEIPAENRGRDVFGRLVCLNVPQPVTELAPLMLQPHGISKPDGAKMGDALAVRAAPSEIFVANRNFVLASVLQRQAARALSPDAGPPVPDLAGAVTVAATNLNLNEAEKAQAIKSWAAELGTEHPAIPLGKLSQTFSAEETAKVVTLSQSVGKFQKNGEIRSTGFVVAPHLVVLPLFALEEDSVEGLNMEFGGPPMPGASFPPDQARITRIVLRDEELMIGLAEIDGPPRTPLKFADKPADEASLTQREILVVGFPVQDPRLPAEFNELIRRGEGAKCVMPGLTDGIENAPGSPHVRLIHDAGTSGGVSGGPVVDRQTQAVLGVHLGGQWKGGTSKRNYSVPIWSLFANDAFREAVTPSGATPRVALSRPAPTGDPLKLASSEPQTIAYDPSFLGVLLPLPTLAASGGSGAAPLDYLHYSIVMNPARKMPRFAAANMDRERRLRVARTTDRWFLDPRISPDAQLGNEAYQGNEWDRGHLISRNAVAWGDVQTLAQRASLGVFYFTNATLQHGNFNRGTWLKLENRVYDELRPESAKVSMFCGPVFDEADLVDNGIKVPRRFWMLAYFENRAEPARPFTFASIATQYENNNGAIAPLPVNEDSSKEVTVPELEQITGLQFPKP